MAKDEKPINRRHFFRYGLAELLKPLQASLEPMQEVLRQLEDLDKNPNRNAKEREQNLLTKSAAKPMGETPARPTPSILPPQQMAWLRPPGALAEQQFKDTCSKCGECVKVCPAQCIKIDPNGAAGNGVPYIDVNAMPCVLCDGLLCMNICPSGALVPTPLNAIDMGTAVWRESACVRTSGENCTICIDQCPVGEMALTLRDGKVTVLEEGCTGCGVCQNRCPTTPRSIVVTPASVRDAAPVARGRR